MIVRKILYSRSCNHDEEKEVRLMLVINQNEVAELLAMESCISVMESVLKALSAGQAVQSLRQVLPLQKE